MSALDIVPCLICLFFVVRGRADIALLSVYLPCLLLAPMGFALRIPHLPPLSISEMAVIPLGFAALYRLARKGLPSLMDVLVGSFVFSLILSEVLNERVTNDGILVSMNVFIDIFLTYAVGRSMVEPELRLSTIKRIVLLVVLLGVPGIYEWRMEQSLYPYLGKIFGVESSPIVQFRGSRGRFEAAFSDTEIAGIAIGMTAALNAWLAYLWKTKLWTNPGRLFTVLEKYHIAGILLLFYVYLTQSRGPEIGLAAGYLILQIPKFKNAKLASFIVAILLALGAIGANQYFSRYTDVTNPNAILDEQQGSAIYRVHMKQLFVPIVEKGGWLGWGYLSIPHVEGLPVLPNGVQSIDSEFLIVQLAQGRLGYILLVLIIAESIRTLVVRSWQVQALDDRAFIFSMIAALAVLWITLITVSMGGQLPQLAFLLIGWGQSIAVRKSVPELMPEAVPRSRFTFKQVFR